MESYNTNVKHINPFIVLNVSVYILAAICFMIYTTQQSYTFAEGGTDLGYDLQSIDASVTVGTACTFTGAITSPHTANISNGIYSDNIGTTILNTKCNDSGGYALYAIGYTNDEYGNTDLSSDISTTYNIPTGTATSGNTSNWAMKLNQVPGTTPATIENGYDNYNIVPDDYTKIATLNTVTDTPSTSTPTGSSVSTTYSAYISPTQPAGTYTGKVKYTLVHPSTAPAPEKPVTIADAFKKSGATKTTQGYYRMQDMTTYINDSVEVIGDSLQVQDIRDDKIYWITKLADGNIWMTQNLDLDIVAGKTYTSADTDLSEDWTPISSTSTTTSWVSSTSIPSSYDPGDYYWNGTVTDSYDTGLTNVEDIGNSHYHLGNYYNWTAAIATNNSSLYNESQEAVQSICPAGWKLPNYENNASYQNLIIAQELTAGKEGNIQKDPAHFVYGGSVYSPMSGVGAIGSIGRKGVYWANRASRVNRQLSYRFEFDSEEYLSPQGHDYRNNGFSVRCVVR